MERTILVVKYIKLGRGWITNEGEASRITAMLLIRVPM